MFQLPSDVKTMIFEYDTTGREMFDKTIHQINFIPVLHCIVFWKSMFGEEWYKSHLFSYQYRLQGGFSLPDTEESRLQSFRRFRATKMM